MKPQDIVTKEFRTLNSIHSFTPHQVNLVIPCTQKYISWVVSRNTFPQYSNIKTREQNEIWLPLNYMNLNCIFFLLCVWMHEYGDMATSALYTGYQQRVPILNEWIFKEETKEAENAAALVLAS